ncbi:hypothetical protein COO60DRAFT_995588 [Scenedesmus sp. NREL 46B-D3]|nr:hypothetical protein COO60DRAFT_995588 [Scenedesmus sp. NREL 46B-D3]
MAVLHWQHSVLCVGRLLVSLVQLLACSCSAYASAALSLSPGLCADLANCCLLQRELNGHNYFEFEYTAKTPRYTRHSLAVVVANDGKRSCGACAPCRAGLEPRLTCFLLQACSGCFQFCSTLPLWVSRPPPVSQQCTRALGFTDAYFVQPQAP